MSADKSVRIFIFFIIKEQKQFLIHLTQRKRNTLVNTLLILSSTALQFPNLTNNNSNSIHIKLPSINTNTQLNKTQFNQNLKNIYLWRSKTSIANKKLNIIKLCRINNRRDNKDTMNILNKVYQFYTIQFIIIKNSQNMPQL